jgi:hypothetical protein
MTSAPMRFAAKRTPTSGVRAPRPARRDRWPEDFACTGVRGVEASTSDSGTATLAGMSEEEQSPPDPQHSPPAETPALQGTGLEPESTAKSKRTLAWIGASVVFLLLVLPTLGSHGTHQRFYDGEQFICFPALGPATSYPASMFEEFEYEPSTATDVGGATSLAKMTRYETERTFRIAVCGEQRSRRVAWALILTVGSLLLGLSAKSDLARSRSDGPRPGP